MTPQKLFSKVRPVLVIAIIAITVAAFVHYFRSHPEYINKISSIHPFFFFLLIFVNFGLISAVAVINHISAQICRVELDKRESFLLTIYSSLANFFGPLQSGPGVRAGYLKTRYGVRLRDFTFVTLVGYGFFAIISALFLVIGVAPWWVTILIVIAVAAVAGTVIKLFGRQEVGTQDASHVVFSPRRIGILAAATVVQVCFTAIRYGIELAAVGASASLGQIVSYAGAANFALFVSITPDGIGIREAFLLFTQRLHGVATNDIVAASLVDRASYVVFLALLGIIALALHAHKRFSIKTPTKTPPKG